MKKSILFAGSEVMPFAATGGLGDVLGSLPAALAAQDSELDVRVVMPLYSAISDKWRTMMKTEAVFTVPLAWRRQYCGVLSLKKDGVTYYFIDNEYYFKRDRGLYGYYDDGERYAFFSRAIVAMMGELDYYPDVLHANDWQTALVPVYLARKYSDDARYSSVKRVFTIHNIEYQGKYDFLILGDVFDLGAADRSTVEYDGCINLMKGAVECAHAVTTVSPQYAREIMTEEFSHGLCHVLRANAGKVSGILNGIDYDYYDPATDPILAKNYSASAPAQKSACRKALRRDLGLPNTEVPLIAVISRLASHKGLDLIVECIRGVLWNTGAQLVVLGRGEERYETFFRELESEFPNSVRALITYDRDLSRRIYAAADIFLMPSKSEPCGLSQMIASRYGAIPVVRETGGLADSIHGYWEDENGDLMGNGFTFANYSAEELYDRIVAATELLKDGKKARRFIKKVMSVDFSWNVSAEKYIATYDSLR